MVVSYSLGKRFSGRVCFSPCIMNFYIFFLYFCCLSSKNSKFRICFYSLGFRGFLLSDHPGRYNRERDREPYFERQGNSNADHRDFKRERELHRDRGSVDYDRERFEKDRHPRDDRYVVLEHF